MYCKDLFSPVSSGLRNRFQKNEISCDTTELLRFIYRQGGRPFLDMGS